tara:strand:- start:1466 stop:1681 length:216 start_codon:yes stop_codon:yes gene_type:complete
MNKRKERLSAEEEARLISEWAKNNESYKPITGEDDPRLIEDIHSYQETMLPHLEKLKTNRAYMISMLVRKN